MNDAPLLDLQVRVAFLEEALNKISDEYYRQQKDLEALKRQNGLLQTKLETLYEETGSESSVVDEKPPHY